MEKKDKYYVDKHNGEWVVLERHFLFHWVKYISEDYFKCIEYAAELNSKRS